MGAAQLDLHGPDPSLAIQHGGQKLTPSSTTQGVFTPARQRHNREFSARSISTPNHMLSNDLWLVAQEINSPDAERLGTLLRGFEPDLLAGVDPEYVPIAALLASQLRQPMIAVELSEGVRRRTEWIHRSSRRMSKMNSRGTSTSVAVRISQSDSSLAGSRDSVWVAQGLKAPRADGHS